MNPFAMVADRMELQGRYPDIDDGLLDDLYDASIHAMWVPFSLPSLDDIVAYLDRVTDLLRSARTPAAGPQAPAAEGVPRGDTADFRLLTMRALHLGKGSWSDGAVARMEAWLGTQRPDLDRGLLRELCLAGYLRHRRDGLTPTRASMLMWLGQTVPRAGAGSRQPRTAAAATRRGGRPKGSGRAIRSPEVFRAAYEKVGVGRTGQPTQAEVAKELGVSVRTLQLRLRDWGIQWAALA